ncbi:MAG: hypothetical protein DRJ49_00890 [Thermoprotei archaeon]|nr:MAG: hypothetical protein DRN53_04485 [Thermoprotei archaeon]RLE90112.1 MAG: hypothetical protein DRJ49_00890 [Thermoprotei archaeon]
MLILIVDNSPIGPYRPRITRFRKRLKELTKVSVKAVSFSSLRLERIKKLVDKSTALILGGFGTWIPREYYPIVYREEFTLIRESDKPILGICGGHQLMAIALGGAVEGQGYMVRGFKKIEILEYNPLFDGLNKFIIVYESHRDHVVKLPFDFKVAATSKYTKIEAMYSISRPLYGVQFHPERYNSRYTDGRIILENFWKIAKGLL